MVLKHIAINGVVLALLAGCAYVMFLLVNNEQVRQKVKNTRPEYVGELTTPFVVTTILFFVPKIFSLLTLVEKYELPQRSLYMTLFR